MNTLVKTTITMPEEIMQMAKLAAVAEHTNVSALIRDALIRRFSESEGNAGDKTQTVNPLRYAGSVRAGIQKAYRARADLYEKHLQRTVAG